MNRIVIAGFFVSLILGSVDCMADEPARKNGVVFECRTPLDFVTGVGCYVIDTGERVVKGVGTIVTAPFKAKLCIPERRRYIYRPPSWTPPQLKPFPKREIPAAPIELHIEPSPDAKKKEVKPLKFYRPLYYPPKNNDTIVFRGGGF